MRHNSTCLSLRLIVCILAAGCTPGSNDTAATGSTSSIGSTSSTSSTSSTGGMLTDGTAGSTSDAPTTTQGPDTSTTRDASTTRDDTLDTTSDGTTTTVDPVEEACQGLEFPPEAPAKVAGARWSGEMSLRLTDVEDYLCNGESVASFLSPCNTGFLLDLDFTAPIAPGEYVEGGAMTSEGASGAWDRDCQNGGSGNLSTDGTVTIYAVTDTCIMGAVTGKEMGDIRFLAPKCA